MSGVRLIIITFIIGIDLSQAACLPVRSHRYPRSRCSTCTGDCPEAIAGQWEFPSASRESYPSSLNDGYPSYSHPQHPFLLLNRPERSSEEENKKVLVVYRADADRLSPEADGPRALSDRELENIVTRAILSARRQAEAEHVLYGSRMPFFEGETARRHPQEFYDPGELRHNFMTPRPQELSRMYGVYGGAADHWEDVNWQGHGKTADEVQLMDPEEFNAVEIVGSGEMGQTEDKKETEESKDLKDEGKEAVKEQENPDFAGEIEAPPAAPASEPEATTPSP